MQKYDIHDTDAQFKSALAALEASKLSDSNKGLISEFIKDASDGLHNPEKAGVKAVGKRKLTPYVYYLIKWTHVFNKEWKAITTDDIRTLVSQLNDNTIKQTQRQKLPYAESTKFHMRCLLKMFLRWLDHKHNLSIKYSFIDVRHVKKTLPDYLEKQHVERLVAASTNTMYKALIMLLFDGGLRIEEALNLHVKDVQYIDTPTKNKLMRVDVRVSKTEARNPELFLAQEAMECWLRIHPQRENPEAHFFLQKGGKEPLTYDAVRRFLKRTSEKVLPNVRMYPHLFRHSSATYYASRLNRQQLCLRYGWAFSSDMPDIYIRRSGVDNAVVVKQFEAENLSELRKQNASLQEQLQILSAKMNDVTDQQKTVDALMSAIVNDPTNRKTLAQMIIDQGLAKQLIEK